MKTQLRGLALGALLASMAACGGGAPSVVSTPGGGTSGGTSGGTGGGTGGAAGSAPLSWQSPTRYADGSVLSDLGSFHVYQGTSTDTSNHARIATINNASVSDFLVENLSAGTYFFSVTAVNSQNVESDFSNVAQITVN